ncbi:hypothetical protein B6V74_01990 [Thioclava sp. F42-5]|uniref:plasmid recombination protein n=1 Tax=Thioclava sp. F42-5 TaxID=1973005 RepID=UPI000B542392|nr:plasmid recombination protein [Thioclava sp. F42-5]OWY10822.1 hypothetical protein B6V74_01990 [Thioclava sp. F42-5]
MSMHQPINASSDTSASSPHPVVLRFAELYPQQLYRYRMHGDRKQQEDRLDHVDLSRTPLNEQILGSSNWHKELRQAVRLASLQNINQQVEGLRAAKRHKEADRCLIEGPRDPWRKSKFGPLREFIITANREWFVPSEAESRFVGTDAEKATARQLLIQEREAQFQARAIEWLRSRFGDQVLHARADRDETTFHIHGVIAPWTEKHTTRSGTQRLLQPSSHPLLKDYEKAQDDIGEFFTSLGLARGERQAAARRKAKEEKKTDPSVIIPGRKKHVPAHVWRANEEVRLAREKAKIEAETKKLEAEQKRAERLQRDTKDQRKALNAANRRAEAREAEANEVIEIATHAATGSLIPAHGDRLAVAPRLPKESRERERLERLLTAPGASARKLLIHLGGAYRAFRLGAARKAENDVAARLAAVAQKETALEKLRAKMIAALPSNLRSHFIADTQIEKREVEEATKALKGKSKNGDQRSR